MLDPQLRRGPVDSAAVYTHSRTRTTSSGALPPFQAQAPIPLHISQQQYPQYQQQYPQQQYQQQYQQYPQQYQYQQHHQQQPGGMYPPQRRSPSVNTFSTTSTAPPPAYRTSPTNDLRRSSSSRSGGSPSQSVSYVAALRRQKGTVWCDRAQPEDPRLAAQLRAAKAKASQAMLGAPRLRSGYPGSASGGRTSTGISTTNKVAAKIRHHGKPGVVGYVAGEDHVGVGGVPPRLSATEVEGESSEEDDGRGLHRRTGSSGRSSTASGRRVVSYRTSGGQGSLRRQSATATPDRTMSLAEGAAIPPAPIPAGRPSDAASAKTHRSGSSAERGDNVAELAHDPDIASISRAAAEASKGKAGAPGLERRGSVDERTMTMTLSAGRLFIANPD